MHVDDRQVDAASAANGGGTVRPIARASAIVARAPREPATHSASVAPILLDDAQGAAVYSVGLRTFLELQNETWFPRPRMLGPRLKRHDYRELLAAVEHMPRQEQREQPAQLLRGRIEKLKRGASA